MQLTRPVAKSYGRALVGAAPQSPESRPLRKIRLVAAGTGGHVTPGLAVADALSKRLRSNIQVAFIGARGGSEAERIPREGYALDLVDGQPFFGVANRDRLRALYRLPRGFSQAIRLLRSERPALVVGFGSYATVPVLLAARRLGIKTAIHEANTSFGISNRILRPFADRVFVGWPQTLESAGHKGVLCGNPIRARPFTRTPRTAADPLRLLICGGSGGSEFLNLRMPKVLEGTGLGSRLEIFHITGKAQGACEAVTKAYERHRLEARVEPYLDDLSEAYRWAHAAVSRAGAITLAELAHHAVPAILVPLPAHALDHQLDNALAFTSAGAGWTIRESEWTDQKVRDIITRLSGELGALRQASDAALELSRPDAADRIAEECERLLDTPQL